MELRHIRYFIAAAEEEHFGRASDRLHVTRPAVSQIIADLEQEISTPLFERLAHRVRLTAAGRSLLPQLQAVMAHLNEAMAQAKRVGEGKTGSLNIGYGSSDAAAPPVPRRDQGLPRGLPRRLAVAVRDVHDRAAEGAGRAKDPRRFHALRPGPRDAAQAPRRTRAGSGRDGARLAPHPDRRPGSGGGQRPRVGAAQVGDPVGTGRRGLRDRAQLQRQPRLRAAVRVVQEGRVRASGGAGGGARSPRS